MITQLFYKQERALRELTELLFDHYELPMYHPTLRYGIKKRLLEWAKTQDLGDVVQGYVDVAKHALKPGCTIPLIIDNRVLIPHVQR